MSENDEQSKPIIKKSLTQQFMGILGAIAVVWYLFVTLVFVLTVQNAGQNVNLSAEQLAYIENTPWWSRMGKAVTVIAGLAGSVYFLMRKKTAYWWFMVSLMGILVIMVDGVFRGGFAIMGGAQTGFSVFLILIGLYMFWTTHNARLKNQLH